MDDGKTQAPIQQKSLMGPIMIEPIVIGGIRYESVWAGRVEFRAVDVKTGKELWKILLYQHRDNETRERDVINVFALTMKKVSDDVIHLTDDRMLVYSIDLGKKTFRIIKWPVYLTLEEIKPLKVKLRISNSLDRTIEFDMPSIGYVGFLSNNNFEVRSDGVDIPYRGEMLKRARPDEFFKLKPLKDYEVLLDLSENYDIPDDAAELAIKFNCTNHFSKDDFEMYTPYPLVVRK